MNKMARNGTICVNLADSVKLHVVLSNKCRKVSVRGHYMYLKTKTPLNKVYGTTNEMYKT